MKKRIAFALMFLMCFPLFGQETLTVIGWNLESGDSDIDVIANRIRLAQDVDIWGFREVQGSQLVSALEAAAEDGESAD